MTEILKLSASGFDKFFTFAIAFPMFINHMPPSNVVIFVFQRLFVHDFLGGGGGVDAMPLWDFCAGDFEVALGIMVMAELFIVMAPEIVAGRRN